MIIDFWAKFVLRSRNLYIKYAETEYLTFTIRGHRYLARHTAPEQPDTPSGRVKFNEWARLYKVEGILYGHWHHFGLFDVDGVRVFRGGSTVGGDSLSESMAKHSEPIQLVWGVNEARISTFFYAVDLNS
jgi:predicted phosphodiesterase